MIRGYTDAVRSGSDWADMVHVARALGQPKLVDIEWLFDKAEGSTWW